MTNKIHPIAYQFVILCAFLIYITSTSSMKISVPLYVVLSVLPFLSGFTRIGRITGILIIISTLYLIFGIVFQNTYVSITTFLAKQYQFIIFLIICETFSVRDLNKIEPLIIIATLFETIICIYLLRRGDLIEHDILRVTAGRQPVGGNMSIAILPLIIFGYFKENKNKLFFILISLILGFWVFRSTVRGYMVLYTMSLLPVFFDYFFLKGSVGRRFFLCFLCALAAFIVVFYIFTSRTTENLSSTIRIEESTGTRNIENKMAISFLMRTAPIYKIFGIGFGGYAPDQPEFMKIVNENTSLDIWEYEKYTTETGTIFHSLYMITLLRQGIIGIFILAFVFFLGLKQIKNTHYPATAEKYSMYLFWIGFFIMNHFRWSCDCGVAEMILFALVLKMIEGADKTNQIVIAEQQPSDC